MTLPWILHPGPLVTAALSGLALWALSFVGDGDFLPVLAAAGRALVIGFALVYAWKAMALTAAGVREPPPLRGASDNPFREPGLLGFLGVDLAMGSAGILCEALMDSGASLLTVGVLGLLAAPAICVSALTAHVKGAISVPAWIDFLKGAGAWVLPIAVLLSGSFVLWLWLLRGAAGDLVTAMLCVLLVLWTHRMAGLFMSRRRAELGIRSRAEEDEALASEQAERAGQRTALFERLHAAWRANELERAVLQLNLFLEERDFAEDASMLDQLQDWSWKGLFDAHARHMAHRLLDAGNAGAAWQVVHRMLPRHPDFLPLTGEDFQRLADGALGPDHHADIVRMACTLAQRPSLSEVDRVALEVARASAVTVGDDASQQRIEAALAGLSRE